MIRRAVLEGSVSWTVGSIIANEATPETEGHWLHATRGLTVRQLRQFIAEGKAPEPETESLGEADEFVTLTVSMDREDAWLFECARLLACHFGARTMDEVFTALTAEGFDTLSALVPRSEMTEAYQDSADLGRQAWEKQLAAWRAQAENMCESRVRERLLHALRKTTASFDFEFRFDGDVEAIDARLRAIAAELASRDIVLGRLAEQFRKGDGWRRLGYATEAQYARERLGMSLSSLDAKRRLARKADLLPQLARAVANHEIGYEAARVISEVATPETIEPWILRAKERTVRHLRDEVAAAEMVTRLLEDGAIEPPSEDLLACIERAESRIVSGEAFAQTADTRSGARATMEIVLEHFRRMSGRPRSGARHGPQISARRALGRVTSRFRVSIDTRRYYRWVERLFRRSLRSTEPFFRFLCRTFIDVWKSALASGVAYASVYARDRYRCRSPVCSRRDVTPHHLRFRSAGGDDSDENVVSLCVWCHLHGVHGGRLGARPPASHIRWELGRVPHTVVDGRRRIRKEERHPRYDANERPCAVSTASAARTP